MINVLIMAGGKGTRFWPLSTEEKPKQFLNLIGDKTMIQLTVDRISQLCSIDHIYVCTSHDYVDLLKNQLPELPEKNIIIEPDGRNTAPCILLSTLYIQNIYGDSKIIVLPADHLIENNKEFIRVLTDACEFLKQRKNGIITLGIKPTRPETGYGYIKKKNKILHTANSYIYKVERFVEKPNIELAKEYMDSGSYYWNAGMFIYNSKDMLELYKKYYEHGFDVLINLDFNADSYFDNLKECYKQCQSISVDYAIMENCKDLYVIPCDFGWDDIGSWNAITRYCDKDDNGNILKGNAKSYKAQNNIIVSENNEVILVDCEDIYCIEANGKIYIGKRDKINLISELKGENGYN